MNTFSFFLFMFKAPSQSTKTGPPALTATYALLAALETTLDSTTKNAHPKQPTGPM